MYSPELVKHLNTTRQCLNVHVNKFMSLTLLTMLTIVAALEIRNYNTEVTTKKVKTITRCVFVCLVHLQCSQYQLPGCAQHNSMAVG